MKCKKHPQYKGVYRPKVNCVECQDWYIICQAARDRKTKKSNYISYDDGYDTYGGGPAPLD